MIMIMIMMMIMIMIMIMIIQLQGVHEANRRECEVESDPDDSIAGDSKDIKKSTVPVRRKKRETWDPWRLFVTRSQGL